MPKKSCKDYYQEDNLFVQRRVFYIRGIRFRILLLIDFVNETTIDLDVNFARIENGWVSTNTLEGLTEKQKTKMFSVLLEEILSLSKKYTINSFHMMSGDKPKLNNYKDIMRRYFLDYNEIETIGNCSLFVKEGSTTEKYKFRNKGLRLLSNELKCESIKDKRVEEIAKKFNYQRHYINTLTQN